MALSPQSYSTTQWQKPALALLLSLLAACGGTPGTPGGGTVGTLETGPGRDIPAVTESTPALDHYASDPLLQPLRAALARGDWLAATLALPSVDDARGDSTFDEVNAHTELTQWLTFYRSRIAYLRGATEDSNNLLEALNMQTLSPALERELLVHKLQRARIAGDAKGVGGYAMALRLVGGHAEMPVSACDDLIWQATQALEAPLGGDAQSRSWWELARSARGDDGAAAAAALDDWLGRYPEHPAVPRAQSLLLAARADAQLQQPVLVLPLTGPLAPAGEAVSGGAFAAFYAQETGPQQLGVIDSRRFNRVEDAYGAALETGADAVLGPLGKLQVSQLLAAGFADVPLLTLNRPDPPIAASGASLQLSLAPEDEAALIARRAFASGARQAVLVRPEGDWGNRMEIALLNEWRALGGQTQARAAFAKAAGYSSVLQRAFNLDASTVRQRDIRKLFSDPVESVGQRRRDIDVIFLLTRNADQARALKPLINYHYAGDLPVYALSTVDDGGDAAANRDLNGIRLPVMPWRLGELPPGLSAANAGDGFTSLHALGADAWGLVRRAHRLASGSQLRFRGHTALLEVGANGALQRELPMAEFSRGQLRPR